MEPCAEYLCCCGSPQQLRKRESLERIRLCMPGGNSGDALQHLRCEMRGGAGTAGKWAVPVQGWLHPQPIRPMRQPVREWVGLRERQLCACLRQGGGVVRLQLRVHAQL